MRATDESDNAIDQLISNLDKLPTMEFPSVGFNAQPIVIGGNDVFATLPFVLPYENGWRRQVLVPVNAGGGQTMVLQLDLEPIP
jgi:hypothetical protein